MSSAAASAVFRLTRAVGGTPGADAAEAATPGGSSTPTRTCSPSTRTRARLRPAMSTPRGRHRRPPARRRPGRPSRGPRSRGDAPCRRRRPSPSRAWSPGRDRGVEVGAGLPAAGPPATGAAGRRWGPGRSAPHHAVTARPTETSTATTASGPAQQRPAVERRGKHRQPPQQRHADPGAARLVEAPTSAPTERGRSQAVMRRPRLGAEQCQS